MLSKWRKRKNIETHNNYISLSHQQENHINLIQTVSYTCEENDDDDDDDFLLLSSFITWKIIFWPN